MINFKWYGSLDYKDSLSLQNQLWQEVVNNQDKGYIIGLEHPVVVTLGKRGSITKDLLFNDTQLQSPLQIVETDRGGQATIHSLGQLVIYPILSLKKINLDVQTFVHFLHKININSLKELGINSYEMKNKPGIYTDKGKICFTGLRIEKHVSRHGISINNKNDLSLFKKIVPCGNSNESLDKIQNYNLNISCEDLFSLWKAEFSQNMRLDL